MGARQRRGWRAVLWSPSEEERRLRESREYHEWSQREDAEKIQRLLRDAEHLSVVYIPPPQSDV